MNTKNKSGKVNELERDVIAKLGVKPDAKFVATDCLGRVKDVSPVIRQKRWKEVAVPTKGGMEDR